MTEQVGRPAPGWSRRMGHSTVKEATPRDASLDHWLITERISRYGWACDERDPDLLGRCFTADAVWEGSVMGTESVGPFVGPDAIVGFLQGRWADQDFQRRHMFSNVVIDDYTGTTATAHAYLTLWSSREAQTSPVTVGPYRLEFVKDTDGLWRMAHLRGGYDSPF